MYQPRHFREDRLEVQLEFIRANPLGLLISAGPGGLIANPVPFTVYPSEGQYGTLRCHVSRANPQWQELSGVGECMAAFLGPQAYISPSWYATKRETGKVVPTWNYAAVHVWGEPLVTEDAAWLRRQIDDLTVVNEARFPEPWAVADAPEPYVAAQVRGIVGIEIAIARIEGKWKMNQNRPHADQEGVIEGLKASGPGADAVSDTMRALRAARQDSREQGGTE